MAKQKKEIPSIYSIGKYLKPDSLLQIYFFCGNDTFAIESATKALEKIIQPLLASDFDKETINGNECSVVDLMDIASSFPFGSEKKLIVLKDFDELKGDKKQFSSYVKNPSPSTILIINKYTEVSNPESEPYTSLYEKKYIFEANELKGNELSNWIVKYAAKNNKTISTDNALALIDIVGENRSMVEMQIQKIFSYLGTNKEITLEIIRSLSSRLKQYNIFDLWGAIGKRNKARALEITLNIMGQDDEAKQALYIIVMLNKYFTSLAQIPELEKENSNEFAKAKLIGTHPFFYKDYVKASAFFNEKKLKNIFQSLMEADMTMKSTTSDPKAVITLLITKLFI